MSSVSQFISLTRDLFSTEEFIPLHAPLFSGNEAKYVNETIESTMVSSVGSFVEEFESSLGEYVNTPGSVAVVNGTSGLQVALRLVGVKPGDEVITQSLTFIATANAIMLNFAHPIFLDVDKDTLGLSPEALESFLEENTFIKNKNCYNIKTGRRISCCVPMHTFGFLCRIQEIIEICNRYYLKVVEDSAEALGSFNGSTAAGTFGDIGVYSFNGNKIITSGGGGAIVSKNEDILKKAKHLTTTAKKAHRYEYFHDEIAYNFRMPNINAALALSQLENINNFKSSKKELYSRYSKELATYDFKLTEIPDSTSSWNYWLISIQLKDIHQRNEFLEQTNDAGVMTRPIWKLLHSLPIYKSFQTDDLVISKQLEETIVNIPSSARHDCKR